jgi:hypothetical protein
MELQDDTRGSKRMAYLDAGPLLLRELSSSPPTCSGTTRIQSSSLHRYGTDFKLREVFSRHHTQHGEVLLRRVLINYRDHMGRYVERSF